MTKQEVIKRLVAHQDELQAQGVKSLALFGSVARGAADQSSDVDVVVELNRPIGLFGLSDLKHMIEQMLGVEKVDLITREGIHPALKDVILGEAIYVI
ncbi:MAG: nucleotidyltransferase family protein [Desulfomonile tiedjei]|nr:nucleotidyltransferase family protein [Desulfomonile tiedjei]